MSKVLLVNRTRYVSRVALLHEGVVRELHFERVGDRSTVGNIYVGRVTRLLPGINAGFLDIGMERAGFIYVGDVRLGRGEEKTSPMGTGRTIEQALKVGQTLPVQVIKDPLKTKGPRLTTQLSLAGRFLVYLPGSAPELGISHRIDDPGERMRLKEAVGALLRPDEAVIIRTVAAGHEAEDLHADLRYLRTLWSALEPETRSRRPGHLVHEELDVLHRTVRDLLTPDFDAVIVDDAPSAERLREFVDRFLPACRGRVRFEDGDEPLFERYGVEMDISRAMDRRVWLASGGYLVIEETEALTAIDVNTGRHVGRADGGETLLRINVEAAREVANQLRLRDIGGIIVVDFIDMGAAEHRARVTEVLESCLAKDRARTRVLPVSEIGLVQITRERVRDSLGRRLSEPCFYCKGRGVLKSAWTLAVRILSKAEQVLADPRFDRVQVVGHPEILEYLADTFGGELAELERERGKQIVLYPREDYHFETFNIVAQRRNDHPS